MNINLYISNKISNYNDASESVLSNLNKKVIKLP